MRAEVLADSDAGRPAISASAQRSAVRYVAGIAALAALYYGAAQVGYALDFAGPVAAIVWLPVGVGVSFLYLGGLRFWPGVLIGDLLANDYATLPVGSALAQTTGNVLEMLAATLLMRRLLRGSAPLGSVRGLGRMLVALAAGTVVSATVGTVALRLGGVVADAQIAHVWRTWWLGDFAGALVVVPLAIAWSVRRASTAGAAALVEGGDRARRRRRAERPRVQHERPAHLRRLPGADLGRAALRPARRDGRRGGRREPDGLRHGPLRRPVLVRVDHAQRAQHAALHRGLRALGALPGRGRLRARALRRAPRARRASGSSRRATRRGAVSSTTSTTARSSGSRRSSVRLRGAELDSREDPERAAAMFAQASAEVSLAIDELRQLARGLHPAILTDFGLASAIRDVAGRSAVPITIVALPEARLRDTVESTAYFVFAEAVTNAQRYAGATVICIRVAIVGSDLRVDVDDDGVGGAVESPGSGLEGLRDRVEAIGGAFTVESPPGHGTRVRARIPLANAEDGDARFGARRIAAPRPSAPT